MDLNDDTIDRILSGEDCPEDLDIDALSGFVQNLRETFAVAASAEVADRHLAMMAATTSAGPVRKIGVTRRRRRFLVPAMVAASLFGASAALAATGTLPGPAQNAVADVARLAGLDLPGGSDTTPPGHVNHATEQAKGNRTQAKLFVDAKKAWTACVADKAAHHEGPGPFDPEATPPAGCGPKPGVAGFKDNPKPRGNSADHNDHADNAPQGGPSSGDAVEGGEHVPGGGVKSEPTTSPTPHAGDGSGDGGHGTSGPGGGGHH